MAAGFFFTVSFGASVFQVANLAAAKENTATTSPVISRREESVRTSSLEVTTTASSTNSDDLDEGTLIPKSIDTLNSTEATIAANEAPVSVKEEDGVHTVPFYSQFADISDASWQKVSCGIASLAMLIDYYKPAVAPDTLLQQGIKSGAYISDAGWSHQGLINLAKKYGLTGKTVGLGDLSMDAAFAKLESAMKEGPVMVSVHYTFVPTNPIPHLVVVNGTKDGKIYYNDPAERTGGGSISISQFKSAWKKRYIEIRPAV